MCCNQSLPTYPKDPGSLFISGTFGRTVVAQITLDQTNPHDYTAANIAANLVLLNADGTFSSTIPVNNYLGSASYAPAQSGNVVTYNYTFQQGDSAIPGKYLLYIQATGQDSNGNTWVEIIYVCYVVITALGAVVPADSGSAYGSGYTSADNLYQS